MRRGSTYVGRADLGSSSNVVTVDMRVWPLQRKLDTLVEKRFEPIFYSQIEMIKEFTYR